jgi:quinoprotein glucose dehydrogenase
MRAQFTVLSTLFASVAIIAWTPPAPTQPNGTLPVTAKPGEWRYLNADPLSTRYSLLDQITKDNFKDLKLVWRWKPAIGPAPSSLGGTAQSNGDPTLAIYKSEATPIMANGVLYESAGGQRVVAAIDAATGKQLWLWNGMDENGRDRKAPRRNAGRGVGYWTDGREERIFVITTGFYLVALNAKTGMAVREFGVNGAVDLMKELDVDFDHVSRIGNSSPPMVYRDTVIVPPALEEGFVPSSMRNTPGYVMAFDARTGKQKWAFHTVPKHGEPGAERGSRTPTPTAAIPACGRQSRSTRSSATHIFPWRRPPTTIMRSPPGQQSVRQFRRLPRSRNGQAHLALPGHAPRHLEL